MCLGREWFGVFFFRMRLCAYLVKHFSHAGNVRAANLPTIKHWSGCPNQHTFLVFGSGCDKRDKHMTTNRVHGNTVCTNRTHERQCVVARIQNVNLRVGW